MRRVLNLSLDTENDSSGFTNITLQIHLLYTQFIYYTEGEKAVRNGGKSLILAVKMQKGKKS